jgi:hypothetical protein
MKHFVSFQMNVVRDRPIEAHIEGTYYPPLSGNMIDPPEHSDLDVKSAEDECGNPIELTDDEQHEAIHAAEETLSEMTAGRENED